MKATYVTANGKLTLEMEYSDDRDLFEKIAHVDEVFGDVTCGAKVDGRWVETKDVKFVVRNVDDNKYYEMWADGKPELRGFRKQFGCHKKGNGLFPKRVEKDSKDHEFGSNGYAKFIGNKKVNA